MSTHYRRIPHVVQAWPVSAPGAKTEYPQWVTEAILKACLFPVFKQDDVGNNRLIAMDVVCVDESGKPQKTRAMLDDWLLHDIEGVITHMPPEEFKANYEPVPDKE